jgi:hypothetical protein
VQHLWRYHVASFSCTVRRELSKILATQVSF